MQKHGQEISGFNQSFWNWRHIERPNLTDSGKRSKIKAEGGTDSIFIDAIILVSHSYFQFYHTYRNFLLFFLTRKIKYACCRKKSGRYHYSYPRSMRIQKLLIFAISANIIRSQLIASSIFELCSNSFLLLAIHDWFEEKKTKPTTIYERFLQVNSKVYTRKKKRRACEQFATITFFPPTNFLDLRSRLNLFNNIDEFSIEIYQQQEKMFILASIRRVLQNKWRCASCDRLFPHHKLLPT